nr:betaine aldehyde dehydrogenase [Hymenolepis microstoma]
MSAFTTSPLTVPEVSHKMTTLQDLLNKNGREVGPFCISGRLQDKVDEKVEIKLSHIENPVNICFSSEACAKFQKPTSLAIDCSEVVKFLKNLSANSLCDFDLLAQSLVGSLGVHFGDLVAFDKSTYVALIAKSLDFAERAKLTKACPDQSKPICLYIPPFDNDFFHVITRILRAFVCCEPVVIYCASRRLMVPLFSFMHCAINASAPAGILSFLPLNKIDAKNSYFSSIQMVMSPADLDSATRAIVKSATYHAGTTSWRPTIVLIEQSYEADFHHKIKSLISAAAGDNGTLNENSHLQNSCVIPAFLKEDLEEFFKLAEKDSGEIIRPSDEAGPVFIFGLTPAAAMLDNSKCFPLGPYSIVLPFRTVNEGLKLAKYFSDRETRFLGAGEYASCIPKSATIWAENSSLSLQVLAKLSGYNVLGVNCDVNRLAASFDLSECSVATPSIHLCGLPVPVNDIFRNVNACAAADLAKTISATEKLSAAWKKISFERRLAVFAAHEEFSSLIPTLKQLNYDSVNQMAPSSSHLTLGDQLDCAFSSKRLCLLRKWQNPCGAVTVTLVSSELLPSLIELVLSTIVLGNVVILAVPKSNTASEEVHNFCNTIVKLVAGSSPTLASLGPIVQVKQMQVCPKGISSALSSLSIAGTLCVSAPEDKLLTAEISVRNLCRFTSVFWSVGGDLFAN